MMKSAAAPNSGTGRFAIAAEAIRVPTIIASGPIDRRSIAYAIAGALLYFLLGTVCLIVSRFDAALASIWLPNASLVALLLIGNLRNEHPTYVGIAVASIAANLLGGTPPESAVFFTLGNLVGVGLTTWLTRRAAGSQIEITDLTHLGHFLLYGGLVGPVVSALLASPGMGPDLELVILGVSKWILAESMGMILIVPAALLIAEAVQQDVTLSRDQLAERGLIMVGGLLVVTWVFAQSTYPMLFLAPPVTLLVAFRLGGLGTVLYVPGVAAVAAWMTYIGLGPIVLNHTSEVSKIYVLQAFVAANFLTGLPIAAILSGRARMTAEMLADRRELAVLAENVTDAVFCLDSKGVMTYASPSTQNVLGRDPRKMIGDCVTDKTHTDAADRISWTLERMMNERTERERFTYRRMLDDEHGNPVFIEADCSVAYDPESAERSGFVVSARDVTERVELELLLTRARRLAEHAARAKSEFLANMSHEIRTPMNGVLGFAELMLQGDLEPDIRRHAEMIVQSGRSMMLLLNDILDLSKIEAGQIDINEAPVDLFATIRDCAALHRPSAEKKGLRLAFSSSNNSNKIGQGDEAPWVIIDSLRLRQIVLNLVGNAVKFTEHGGIEVNCILEDSQVRVEVRDSGIGISASRIDTIFAPFTQGESDTARRFGGTGLGLTISRQLAELLGGSIEVQSEPGVGSCFVLSLPTLVALPKDHQRFEPEVVEPTKLPQSASILLVEDHDVNRLLGSEMLERCGQSVAIAHDGNEAIAMVIDSVMRGTPYDLVLMDIQMPGCDGYAATRAIRAEGISPETLPIIALTANAFPEDIAAARDAGMQAHLAKPLVFSDLARALQRWLPTRIVESEDDRGVTGGHSDAADIALADIDEFEQEMDRLKPDLTSPGRDRRMVGPRRRSTDRARQSGPATSQRRHSAELFDRWKERRSEAVEAVREALENGKLSDAAPPEISEDLARLVHKLAGTAAIFGEPELGDHAAAFERALRQEFSSEVREALAFELLSVADDPADTFA